MEQRLSLITLGVADLRRARAFYEDGLGFARGTDETEIAFYQLPGIVLALFDRAALATDAGLPNTPSGFGGVTLSHNVASPAEVDAVLAHAVAAGATLTRPAAETDWGGYSGYFTDPDGHPWEVAHNPLWVVHADGRTTLS